MSGVYSTPEQAEEALRREWAAKGYIIPKVVPIEEPEES